jgi:pseudouridine synthase
MRLTLGDQLKVDDEAISWEDALKLKRSGGAGVVTTNASRHLYIKLWKPRGVECTGNTSVKNNVMSRFGFDLLRPRVFTVGRLDKDSSGLLLLTSDGEWANKIQNKSNGIIKRYEILTSRAISDSDIDVLRNGVDIWLEKRDSKGDMQNYLFTTHSCKVERFNYPNYKDRALVIELIEGKNRQIRKMIECIGSAVEVLHRTQVGDIDLSGLRVGGDWAYIEF